MFSDPEKVVEQCGIQPGMDIADFGSGSGFYSISAAKHLMSSGRVYAIDMQKDLLSKLKNSGIKSGVYNIEVIWGDVEKEKGTKLRDSSINMVFICNIFFQIENKEGVINEAKRILKPGGKVVFVEWADSFGGMGPKPKTVFKKDKAVEMFEKMGFHKDKELIAGEHHYGFIFKKL